MLHTLKAGHTTRRMPGSDAQHEEHEPMPAALKAKAETAGIQVDTAACSAVDTIQADLDDAVARIAQAGGNARNERPEREAQLRARLDPALMDLRSGVAEAASQVAADAVHSK